MRLTNRSNYPTDEVRQLVEFGMHGVRTERLAVHVRNGRAKYAGVAYDVIPSESPRAAQATVDRLVTIRIGPETDFPADNMDTTRRWVPVPDAEYEAMAPEERRRLRYWIRSDGRSGADRQVVERHPYGGKRSPLITMTTWREAVVAVAAHEARHIWQYQHSKPRSEVDAEKFAARALDRYRASLA